MTRCHLSPNRSDINAYLIGLAVFAGITGVPNTPTQITERATPAAIARISAMRRKTKNREKVHASSSDVFGPFCASLFTAFQPLLVMWAVQ